MSSSNAELLAANETATNVAVPSENAGTERANLHHVDSVGKTSKELGAARMSQSHSHTTLVKPDHVEVVVHDAIHFPSGSENHLLPSKPGTKGFYHKAITLKNKRITWVADTYAYRHANSDDVTVIVIHSGVPRWDDAPNIYQASIGTQ
ncbi:hypothetical protein BDP27DRAFT_1430400 [Rhodocollybia butyracea]|uniref:Uncharacterized protein n=1 Tax=Rhodocollybia butyracea TaxID=206335 RepID=A0A9P5PCE3_9AGAR|nr:hypothetical protein BDP27DRAFT_1430400 [Rhodocollybia butyracea]